MARNHPQQQVTQENRHPESRNFGLGVVYLLVGVVGFVVPDLFGLLPHEYKTVLDNLIHLSLGVLGITVGFFLGSRRPVAQS